MEYFGLFRLTEWRLMILHTSCCAGRQGSQISLYIYIHI